MRDLAHSGLVTVRCLLPLVIASHVFGAVYLDIAPSGKPSTWTDAGVQRMAGFSSVSSTNNIGLEWDEERDVREVQVNYTRAAPLGVQLEY